MGFSLSHLIIVLLVVLIVFGAGKLPQVMADVGKGIRNLRDELKKDDTSQINSQLPSSKESNS